MAKGGQVWSGDVQTCANAAELQQNDAVSPRRSKPSYYRACPEIPEQQRDTTERGIEAAIV